MTRLSISGGGEVSARSLSDICVNASEFAFLKCKKVRFSEWDLVGIVFHGDCDGDGDGLLFDEGVGRSGFLDYCHCNATVDLLSHGFCLRG